MTNTARKVLELIDGCIDGPHSVDYTLYQIRYVCSRHLGTQYYNNLFDRIVDIQDVPDSWRTPRVPAGIALFLKVREELAEPNQ